MQDVWIMHPLGHVRQQEVMSDVVAVCLPVNVDDACCVLHDRVRNPLTASCALRLGR